MVGMLVHGFGPASKWLNVCNGTVEQLALDRFATHLFGLESEMIGRRDVFSHLFAFNLADEAFGRLLDGGVLFQCLYKGTADDGTA